MLLTACGGGGGGGFNPAAAGSVTPGSSSTGNSSGNNTAPPTPVYSIGNGSGTGYTDGVIDASKTTLQAAETATLRVNIVDQFNNPPATDLVVTFSSTCTSDGLASFGDVTQVARGLFSVTYTNKGCDKAADVVTALLVTNNKQATVTLKMVGPDVISVSFVSATFTQLALAGIGGNETSELIFQVSGPQAVPVVGKTVNFSVNTQVGGASILSGRQSAVTDQAGQVHTIITSGTIAGPVNVRAVEQSTGKQGISPDIVISTGIADADRFSMTLGPHNPGLAWNTDAVTVNINIIASDIFGNNPTDGTRVSFVSSESGNITNSCLLTDGACSATWRSSASRPLDMRATVMAYTSGAEHFTDNNGNGVYDSTDTTFKDLGEAYADENENGQYDVGEYFVDTNKNGVRDPGNNLWDGPCLSKVDSRAVCTGNSTVTISGSQVIVMSRSDVRIKTLGTFPDPALGTIISVTKGGYADLGGMYLEDGNTNADILGGNPLPNQSTVVFSIEGDSLSLKGISSYTISDGISPESSPPLGVSIFADSGAVSGTTGVLRMTVTAPGLTTQFTWSVKIP
ncbi:MAG TPA: hypothetical protein VMH83_09805 [Candidatus Acidoferrum sp.]|nr:hypothetical protein [Candidatus Acidoferrum sp.]